MKALVINTLIVDDEPLSRENVKILLQNDPEINIVAEARNGAEAATVIRERNIDLLFLDIQMPELNGFQLLEKIKDMEMPVVVFITAYDQYAIQAFQVHAIDYLLKPYSDEDFYTSLRNAKEFVKLKNNYTLSEQLRSLLEEYTRSIDAGKQKCIQRFAVSMNNKTIFIKTDDVDWIESADYYVQLHIGNKTHLLRESMNRLEEQLDIDKFVRIHRSTIVNIERIREIESAFNGDSIVTLKTGAKLKLSRSRKKLLKEKLNLKD